MKLETPNGKLLESFQAYAAENEFRRNENRKGLQCLRDFLSTQGIRTYHEDWLKLLQEFRTLRDRLLSNGNMTIALTGDPSITKPAEEVLAGRFAFRNTNLPTRMLSLDVHDKPGSEGLVVKGIPQLRQPL